MIMNCVVTIYDDLDNLSISVIWCFSKSISLREVYQYIVSVLRDGCRERWFTIAIREETTWDCAKCIVEFATL